MNLTDRLLLDLRLLPRYLVRRPRVPAWRRLLGERVVADELVRRAGGTGVHVAPAAQGSDA